MSTLSDVPGGTVVEAPEPFVGDDGVKVVGLEVVDSRLVGREGGFLGLRRMRLRVVRGDGTRSAEILNDFVERPKGLDAVAVAIWARGAGGVQVLVRQGMRPTIFFGRAPEQLVVPDLARRLFVAEVVAGIVEVADRGEAGLRRRAAAEVEEEAGVRVKNARYFGSQPWPFPHSLMIGFTAEWESGEIRIDPAELSDAKWFSARELPVIPPPLSIARRLIDAWVAEITGA